jgi:hypothetical protein
MKGKSQRKAGARVSALVVGGVLVAMAAPGCGARTGLPLLDGAPADGDEPGGCASFQSRVEPAPLDIFVALDASGSMAWATPDDLEKWVAVRVALDGFFHDARTAKMGAAITFFPRLNDAVPDSCSTDADCGIGGPCKLSPRACTPDFAVECQTDADCGNGMPGSEYCVTFGICEKDPEVRCYPDFDAACTVETHGAELGACLPGGYCDGRVSCAAEDYATPDAPLATLPAGADALLDAVIDRRPKGGTPMLPALSGTIVAAKRHGLDNPRRKPIVILATDGVPSFCSPSGATFEMPMMAQIEVRDAAADGLVQGIQTFVVGVTSLDPEEEQKEKSGLGFIAEGGGAKSAFFVSASGQLTEGFFQALLSVRAEAQACEYALPDTGKRRIVPSRVEVRILGAGEVVLSRVAGPTGCTASGGFYFDTDVSGGDAAGRVILCPVTCERVQTARAGVEVIASCP